MPRSVWKGGFIEPSLLKKVMEAKKAGSNKQIKTWSRASMIIPQFVDHVIAVHNGKAHIPVFVKDEMIGHKLGEFAPTRLFRGHSGDKKGGAKAGAKGGAKGGKK
jgi:small subunit ribosomal protein S19